MTTAIDDDPTPPEGYVRRRLYHDPACSRPDEHVWQGREELMLKCPSCKTIGPLFRKAPPEKVTPDQLTSAPSLQRPLPSARYVCREHLAAVNWRGKGLPCVCAGAPMSNPEQMTEAEVRELTAAGRCAEIVDAVYARRLADYVSTTYNEESYS